MVVGFTTTYAISAYHHWSCEFESRSGDVYSIQHYVIKFVSDLRQVCGFLRALQIPPPKNWPRDNWNIVESGIKHKSSYHDPKVKTSLDTLYQNTNSQAVLNTFILHAYSFSYP